jgi:hypothetical protein
MPIRTPRSFAPHFRIAAFVLGGLVVLLFLLSLAVGGSPDLQMQSLARGCRAVLPWLIGVVLICALLAYALRPGEDVGPATEATEFSPDLTDFARSAMPSETAPPRRDSSNDSTMA